MRGPPRRSSRVQCASCWLRTQLVQVRVPGGWAAAVRVPHNGHGAASGAYSVLWYISTLCNADCMNPCMTSLWASVAPQQGSTLAAASTWGSRVAYKQLPLQPQRLWHHPWLTWGDPGMGDAAPQQWASLGTCHSQPLQVLLSSHATGAWPSHRVDTRGWSPSQALCSVRRLDVHRCSSCCP